MSYIMFLGSKSMVYLLFLFLHFPLPFSFHSSFPSFLPSFLLSSLHFFLPFLSLSILLSLPSYHRAIAVELKLGRVREVCNFSTCTNTLSVVHLPSLLPPSLSSLFLSSHFQARWMYHQAVKALPFHAVLWKEV